MMALSDKELLAVYLDAYEATFDSPTLAEMLSKPNARTQALQAVARAVAADCADLIDDVDNEAHYAANRIRTAYEVEQ